MAKSKEKSSELIYQYPIMGVHNKELEKIELETDVNLISKLVLGMDWQSPFLRYSKRGDFYWGFSITCRDYTVVEGKIEALSEDLNNLVYLIEVSLTPEKLAPEDLDGLINLVESLQEDDLLDIWWEGDAKSKRKKNQVTQILKDLKKISVYQREDDLDWGVIEIPSVEEALVGLGFKREASKKEVKLSLKKTLSDLRLKYHPDICGDDSKFKEIQTYKAIVEDWLLEDD